MKTPVRDLKAFFPFIGIGGAPRGFQKARPHIRGLEGRWRVIGGIDSDAGAVANAARILAARITVGDLFSAEQYEAFHGRRPPEGWSEMTPADVRVAAGGEFPDLALTSPPCKGFSGLLPESMSITDKYQALNALALRGVWLCLEAFKDDPPSFFCMENVPRMGTRGRRFLDQVKGLLHAYGYAVAETVHNCGELGGLAQNRKRLLLVARHMEKVPNFLYQPPCKPLRAVGDVLGRLPIPGSIDDTQPLHRLPKLHWKTWVRLAFVEAGSDWRSLNRLTVEDGVLSDYALIPTRDYQSGYCGVQKWDDTSGTVAGRSSPTNGAFSVADPRFDAKGNDYCQYGVIRWDKPTGAMINIKSPGQGVFTVADPRHTGPAKHNNEYRVARWAREAGAVTSAHGTGQCIADPRFPWGDAAHQNKFRVGRWTDATGTLICTNKGPGSGALSVADPRPRMDRSKGYVTGGHYGVVPWASTSYAVTGSGQHDNGHNSVADPRVPPSACPRCCASAIAAGHASAGQLCQSCDDSLFGPDPRWNADTPNVPERSSTMPAPNDKLQCVITAEDGTWHRPFTTLETAALQSLFDIEEFADFELRGASDSTVREWVGNAIPGDAAEAMAEVFGQAILLASSGETFILSNTPIWVRPMIAAIQCGSVA